MDVVLGVAVTGPVARLALVGTGDEATGVIDQSVVDLANNPIEQLLETVVGTNRLLAGENHRLVGTRLCWTDNPKADELRQALEDSGVHNVAVLSESQAVKSLMRAAGRPGAALLFDDETATLSLVDPAAVDEDAPPTLLAQAPLTADDDTGTLDTLMARLGDQPNTIMDVYLVGASADLDRVADQLRETSTMRVQIAEDPTFALARGAALAAAPLAPDATAMAPAVLTGDETAMAPAAGLAGDATAADQQLAYSMTDDDAGLFAGELDEFDDYYDPEAETGPLKLDRRSLLIGNAVIAFAVVGFASLAVALVVGVRPTAAQEPVVGHQNAAPGKFMPLLPTQQQAPVPPPPPEAPNAGYQGGVIPAPAQQGPSPALVPGGPAPVTPGAPGVPGIPGFVPNPNPGVPIPVPIIIPFPGWQPYPPPWVPPYTPPTKPTTPTTTPTTPTTPTSPTSPTSPTTTPYTPPTTPTTTPYTPITPTTTVAPTTTPYTPITPTTTVAPTTVAPTTVEPTTKAPTTVAPTQAPTVAPTQAPTVAPTQAPTVAPTQAPTVAPTQAPVIPTQPHTQAPVVPQQPHTHS